MSSRSLAAARAKRAGEQAPPVSGNRPVTSIGSHAAFAQQMPNGMGYNVPPPPNNVRVSRSMQPPQSQAQQQFTRQPPPQYNQFYDKNKNQSQQAIQQSNSLPFSKLSISDAIGLITLRLGRVEQWIIETDHEGESKSVMNVSGNHTINVPDNHKIIDNSVLSTIISRLDSLEKNTILNSENNKENVSDKIIQIQDDVKTLNEQIKNIGDIVTKHTIELSKNTEEVFKFNRELTETKDILKSFMLKYDHFTQETSQTFSDYENALTDIERRFTLDEPEIQSQENDEEENNYQEPFTNLNDIDTENNIIMASDLKSLIKQELANS